MGQEGGPVQSGEAPAVPLVHRLGAVADDVVQLRTQGAAESAHEQAAVKMQGVRHVHARRRLQGGLRLFSVASQSPQRTMSSCLYVAAKCTGAPAPLS